MAPALIEAAASVSQNPKRKFDFIKTDLLEGLANDLTKERGITSTTTGRISETKPGSGRPSTQVAERAWESQVVNKEDLSKLYQKNIIQMEATSGNHGNIETRSPSSLECENTDQSTGPNIGATSETCARSEVEGGKTEGSRSQPCVESTPYIALKAKTSKANDKFKSLDRRARCLKQRLRSFQNNRLLSHIKSQALYLDQSNKTPNDPRTKIDRKSSDTTTLVDEKNKSPVSFGRSSEANPSSNGISSPSLMSLLRNESARKTVAQAPSPTLDARSDLSERNNGLSKTTTEKKKEVFSILTDGMKEIMNLEDAEATDPESDEDDILTPHINVGKSERVANQSQRKGSGHDRTWAKDRVKIGSMCTWVQAQIADLSHKIKRYGDLHHHIKTNRKQLVLEEKRKPSATGIQRQIEESFLSKDDLNGESLQSNIFAKLQAHKNGLAKEFSTDNEMKYEKGSGARTIPVSKFPQHKYVKQSIETAFRGSSVAYKCTNLPAPFPCAQCLKAAATGFGRPLANIAAVNLDHSYHEQLSTKYDLPLPLLLESTLRKEKICSDKKTLSLAADAKSALAEKKEAGNRALRESVSASRAPKNAKLRQEKKRHRRFSKHGDEESDKDESPVPRKKVPPPSAASLLQRRASSLKAPSSGSGESRPSTPVTEQGLLSASCPAPTLSQLVKQRKTRTSSEYDINNIVIPYSISSSTRLEKPQYKEILTPGWRPARSDAEEHRNSVIEESEDTRDVAYTQRHSNYEITEHHKFNAFFQLPFKRSRSSRKSSECNTPEPYSPSHPDTPCSAPTPTDFVLATPTSSSRLNKQSSWTLTLNSDDGKAMPWSKRQFPLVGDDLANLDYDNPPILTSFEEKPENTEKPTTEDDTKELTATEEKPVEANKALLATPSDNELESPPPEATEPLEDEDDSEKWTVKLVTDQKPSTADQGSPRKGIVLKLAKK